MKQCLGSKGTACVALIALVLSAACAPETAAPEPPHRQDLVIRDVRIIDGSGNPAFTGHLRVSNGVITGVGDLSVRDGDRTYDGGGLVLAPGFIDTHSHAGRDLLAEPGALPAVSQGITTVVVGQDGSSPWPLAEYFAELEETPVAINVAISARTALSTTCTRAPAARLPGSSAATSASSGC